MARPLRIEYPGSIYHLTVRMLGNWKRESNRLFEDERDRFGFLERLGERVESFEIRLYLVTLMANHVHLVLETPHGNLSRFMHSLSTSHTVYFNRRHQRHGHLLDGRYTARVMEGPHTAGARGPGFRRASLRARAWPISIQFAFGVAVGGTQHPPPLFPIPSKTWTPTLLTHGASARCCGERVVGAANFSEWKEGGLGGRECVGPAKPAFC